MNRRGFLRLFGAGPLLARLAPNGAPLGTVANPFHGEIQAVRVYRKALSPEAMAFLRRFEAAGGVYTGDYTYPFEP